MWRRELNRLGRKRDGEASKRYLKWYYEYCSSLMVSSLCCRVCTHTYIHVCRIYAINCLFRNWMSITDHRILTPFLGCLHPPFPCFVFSDPIVQCLECNFELFVCLMFNFILIFFATSLLFLQNLNPFLSWMFDKNKSQISITQHVFLQFFVSSRLS